MPELFRPCVAAILRNPDGKILIAERNDYANSWQFPQGGQDEGETPREALIRELFEELSVQPQHYEVTEQRAGYRYFFPNKHRRSGKYVGQEQVYFLCEFTAPDSVINLRTKHPEFRSWRWIEPQAFDLAWLPTFKREVYQQVLADFFNVRLAQ